MELTLTKNLKEIKNIKDSDKNDDVLKKLAKFLAKSFVEGMEEKEDEN